MNYELFKARKEARLTQAAVAKKSRIRRERYNQIELNKTKPTFDEAILIGKAVNKQPNELFLVDDVRVNHNEQTVDFQEAANV